MEQKAKEEALEHKLGFVCICAHIHTCPREFNHPSKKLNSAILIKILNVTKYSAISCQCYYNKVEAIGSDSFIYNQTVDTCLSIYSHNILYVLLMYLRKQG